MKLRAVGIISKPKKEDICAVAPGLLDWLKKHGIEAVCDQQTLNCLGQKGGLPREDIPAKVDLLAVLGGDGTLLAAARRVLDAEVERGGKAVTRYRALNDIVLHKAALARIVDFDVSVGGRFVSRIRADGLIFSTPTGSTAYSLSAGGPIVLPSVEAMVMTPIAPPLLTHRPLVMPGESRVEVRVHNPGEAVYVTVDGQAGEELHNGDRVRVSKSDRVIRLVVSPNRDYFQVLRSKLHWGER